MRARLNEALALLHSGDPERIGEALAILQGTVFAFSMKVCGHREDAEDTMQEVLLRSLPHLSKMENPRALAVWLYTVTRNRCWRSRRKPAHAPRETLSLDEWAAMRLLRRSHPEKESAEHKESGTTRLYRRVMSPLVRSRRHRHVFLAGIAVLLLAAVAFIPLKLVHVKMLSGAALTAGRPWRGCTHAHPVAD